MHGDLEIGAASFAFLAAAFWFFSANGKLPPMIAYWDSTPEHDPLYQSLKFSGRMNKWAALFSCLSALCSGASILV
jgi:hypothetical protein